jgi:hypothetical protein
MNPTAPIAEPDAYAAVRPSLFAIARFSSSPTAAAGVKVSRTHWFNPVFH